jgi:hypothetical protein
VFIFVFVVQAQKLPGRGKRALSLTRTTQCYISLNLVEVLDLEVGIVVVLKQLKKLKN